MWYLKILQTSDDSATFLVLHVAFTHNKILHYKTCTRYSKVTVQRLRLCWYSHSLKLKFGTKILGFMAPVRSRFAKYQLPPIGALQNVTFPVINPSYHHEILASQFMSDVVLSLCAESVMFWPKSSHDCDFQESSDPPFLKCFSNSSDQMSLWSCS